MAAMRYHSILNEPNAFWVATCNDKNIPDVTRIAGLAPVEDLSTITFYLSEAFGKDLLKNLHTGQHLTLLVTSIHTFESFQYKGICQSVRLCTQEEQERQRQHIEGFTSGLNTIGIAVAETEKIRSLYFQQPSHAITFHVQQIFTQQPQKDAGKLVLNLEEANG